MKRFGVLALFLAILGVRADHPAPKNGKAAVLIEGLGPIHHPVSTKNAEAQKFFDQGLRLIYAFNHDEAHRAFARAAELDNGLAMAHWGMALAVGPNYNLDAEESQLKSAYASIQKAIELSKNAPEHEQAYILALAKRYAADPKKADKKQQALAYKNAMGELTKRYPDDLDAATLYAESMMNLRPWELWSPDGKAAEGTEEIIAVLASVMRRNPNHTGANHYYVHAVEASPTPERGLASAERLKTLAPNAGHLVHMPAHIYLRVGDYAAAAERNKVAAAVDRAYIEKFNIKGVYPMMYYSHNLHFLAVAHHMQGRYKDAKEAADQLAAHVAPHVHDMPMLEFFLPTPLLVQVRFGRWDEILNSAAPNDKLPITKSIWHFARGLALVEKVKMDEAKGQLDGLTKLVATIPDDTAYGDRNKARKVLVIPEWILQAKLAAANKDVKTAETCFQKAIEAEDGLNYIEPSDWHMPVREMLGNLHIQTNHFAAAEKVFRADLERNRRNPRSLFGLVQALKAQGKTYAADLVRQELEAAWKNADVQLSGQ